MKDIKKVGKKIIKLDTIREYYNIADYNDLVIIIKSLEKQGDINKVVSSKTNGMNPPLYNKYRVITESVNYDKVREKIDKTFPVFLDRGYYLKNISNYLRDESYIDKLINYLRYNSDNINTPLSINERSLEIWGEEKYLKDGRGKTVLNNLGFSIERLNIYYSPEPFIYFSINKNIPQKILIIENKDTWYTMRRLMLEGQTNFYNISIDTIIYGCGKRIENALAEYKDTVEEYLYNPEVIYYWGDIDYEGIGIYERLKNKYNKDYALKVFSVAYSKMLKKSKEQTCPKLINRQNKNIKGIFYDEVQDLKKEIIYLLESGYYVPQEIINYRDLKRSNEDVWFS